MERSLYPDGVVVEESDLSNTEQTRSYHIQRRQIDSAQHGRAEGLLVTIGSPATRVQISAGRGYTPRGDLIEVPTLIQGVALQDYTASVENLVCLAYDETLDRLQTHETLGRQMPTRATASYQVVVLTRANYSALPDTSSTDLRTNIRDANLASFAKDRLLVLRVVTGNGYSGGAPITLTSAQLGAQAVYQPDFTARLNGDATLVGSGSIAATLPGVSLKDISGSGLAAGTGTLTYARSGSGDKTFTWTYPATGTVSTATSAITDSPTIQTYALISGGVTLIIEVAPALLPQPSGVNVYSYTQSVVVEPIYATDAQRYSATDDAHRDLQGSYLPSTTNPHGLGYQDLVGEVAVINKPLLLGNELRQSETEALIPRISTPRAPDSVANTERTLLWEMGEGAKAIRLYKTSSDALEIVVNARYDGANWVKDDSSTTLATRWVFAVDGLKYQRANQITSYFDEAAFVDVFTGGLPTPNSLLNLGGGFQATQDALRARIGAATGTGTRTLLFEQGRDPGLPRMRMYLFNDGLEITSNAGWYVTGWIKDNEAATASLFSISSSTWEVRYRAAGASGQFVDWTSPNTALLIGGDAATGAVSLGGKITSGGFEGAASLSATSPRFISGKTFGAAPSRVLISDYGATSAGVRIRQYAGVLAAPHFATEETAFNCFWNGTNWTADDTMYGSAYVIRKSRIGTSYLIKTSFSPLTWPDNNWDQGSGIDTTRVVLPSANAQPAHNAAILANALYATSMIKAWGVLQVYEVAPGTMSVSVLSGFNVNTAAIGPILVPSDARHPVRVTFTQPLANANYLVIGSAHRDSVVGASEGRADYNYLTVNNSTNDDDRADEIHRFIIPSGKSASQVDLIVVANGASDEPTQFPRGIVDLNNFSRGNGMIIQFMVLGNQPAGNVIA